MKNIDRLTNQKWPGQGWASDGTRWKNVSPFRNEFLISIPDPFRPRTNFGFASPSLVSQYDSKSGHFLFPKWKLIEKSKFNFQNSKFKFKIPIQNSNSNSKFKTIIQNSNSI